MILKISGLVYISAEMCVGYLYLEHRWSVWKRMGAYRCMRDAYECIQMHMMHTEAPLILAPNLILGPNLIPVGALFNKLQLLILYSMLGLRQVFVCVLTPVYPSPLPPLALGGGGGRGPHSAGALRLAPPRASPGSTTAAALMVRASPPRPTQYDWSS